MTAAILAGRDWRDLAACRRVDPEVFFPTAAPGTPYRARQTARALNFCTGCPVRPECLDFALRSGIADGVWGGMGEEERKRAGLDIAAEPLPVLCPSGLHLTRQARGCEECAAERKREASIVQEMTRVRDQSGRKGPRRGRRKGVKGIAA